MYRSADVQVYVRRDLAVMHLLGAARFAQRAHEIETAPGASFNNSYEAVSNYCVGCVLMAVAAIEALLNEILEDINAPDVLKKCADSGDLVERTNGVLLHMGVEQFEKGKTPAQDMRLLVTLRNALTHYRPEWDNLQDKHARLGKKLKNSFQPSRLFFGEGGVLPSALSVSWLRGMGRANRTEFWRRIFETTECAREVWKICPSVEYAKLTVVVAARAESSGRPITGFPGDFPTASRRDPRTVEWRL